MNVNIITMSEIETEPVRWLAYSYLFLFLIFLSSAFVPIQSMHGIVRSFAENQPMTPIIETIRSLLTGARLCTSSLPHFVFNFQKL